MCREILLVPGRKKNAKNKSTPRRRYGIFPFFYDVAERQYIHAYIHPLSGAPQRTNLNRQTPRQPPTSECREKKTTRQRNKPTTSGKPCYRFGLSFLPFSFFSSSPRPSKGDQRCRVTLPCWRLATVVVLPKAPPRGKQTRRECAFTFPVGR